MDCEQAEALPITSVFLLPSRFIFKSSLFKQFKVQPDPRGQQEVLKVIRVTKEFRGYRVILESKEMLDPKVSVEIKGNKEMKDCKVW